MTDAAPATAPLPEPRVGAPSMVRQLAAFVAIQAAATVFPFSVLAILAITLRVHVPGIYRYDLILLLCLLVQAAMVWTRLETRDELKVICVFHVLGIGLELYKTKMGSWAYPEPGWAKVGAVPLYSGFMYASVASYMCQAWRRFDLHLAGWTRSAPVVATAATIYGNFFSHHFLPDLRWVLTGVMCLLLVRASVSFVVCGVRRRMPIVVAMLLIGLFVWIGENAATFLGAWAYPNQTSGWRPVHIGKISSWALLAVISFIVVAELKHVKRRRVCGGTPPDLHEPVGPAP